MLDREKIVAVLKRRFPGAAAEQVAAAANAIVGLEDEWVELSTQWANGGGQGRLPCGETCYLAEALRAGVRIRIFQRLEGQSS